jgi:hypothetical protein
MIVSCVAKGGGHMCTMLDRLFLDCGTTPTVEYTLVAAGIAALIVFLVRP